VRAVCGESRTYGFLGGSISQCSGFFSHPICSMIYGSTGATHFDQLAKILTGYEITGSSGIFMGILSIAVGFLFKITAVPFRAAYCRTAAYSLYYQRKVVSGNGLERVSHHNLVRALRP